MNKGSSDTGVAKYSKRLRSGTIHYLTKIRLARIRPRLSGLYYSGQCPLGIEEYAMLQKVHVLHLASPLS